MLSNLQHLPSSKQFFDKHFIVGTSTLTTPSSFYEPPPMDHGSNEGSNSHPSNTDAHDINTDDIHLTTAFPNPSTTSSNPPILTNTQDFLLPPVVNPPQITNEITEDTFEVVSMNNEVPVENVNVDSLTGKKEFNVLLTIFSFK